MSGARRKSKHPQKWEESLGQNVPSQNRPSSFEKSEHDAHGSSGLNPSPGIPCDESLMRSFSPSFFGHPKIPPRSEGDVKLKTKSKFSAEDYSQDDSSEEEGDLGARGAKASESEMTVLNVLQGSRQGLVAECKACSIQLKDWTSTVGHIQSHRLGFIPLCVRDSEKASLKQSVKCLVCQKHCQNLSALAVHANTEHNLIKSPAVCPFCGRVFPSVSLLQKHIDVRDICMKCPVCSAVYDQEYELYSHLSDCLPTFHPHLKSLVCHVCKQRLPMASLADHMIYHSVRAHEGRLAKLHRKSGSSSKQSYPIQTQAPNVSNYFLCEICDRRFSVSRFKDFRRHLFEHTETRMFCPLCFLKGFEKKVFILRHLVLRCPKRSREQFEFGCILSLIGKEKQMSFLQLLKFVQHLQPFMEGFSAWNSIPLVQEVLKHIGKIRIEEPLPGEGATDIDLLLWLTDFEREFQNPHSEIHHRLSRKELFAPPEVKDRCESDQASVMENLPVDVACSKPSRPTSASDIRKNYPGVRLLHEVDLKRLKMLYDEAMSYLEKDLVADQIENGTFSSDHFVRLEWEAQFLREKEPFYLPSLEDQRLFVPSFKKFKRFSSPNSKAHIDPDVMARIRKELDEMQDEKQSLGKDTLVDSVKLSALLQEAKEG